LATLTLTAVCADAGLALARHCRIRTGRIVVVQRNFLGNPVEQPMPALKRLQWSVDIAAPASQVYDTLIDPDSYKQWTSAFGDGLYFEGSWQQGQRIRFLTPGGEGVVSEIAENRPHEFLSIRHLGYIIDGVDDTSSEAIRAWAPAYENYTFTTTPQGTKVTVEQDMTDEFEGMVETWPKALSLLKALCEHRAR
jgi:uncharacterized protein YndB with AHSA1/START domain